MPHHMSGRCNQSPKDDLVGVNSNDPKEVSKAMAHKKTTDSGRNGASPNPPIHLDLSLLRNDKCYPPETAPEN